MAPVEYAAELKKLVDYQRGKGYTVCFKMEALQGSDPRRARIHALKRTDPEVETRRPLIASFDPIAVVRWEFSGYVSVLAVDERGGAVMFQLTQRGIQAVGAK